MSNIKKSNITTKISCPNCSFEKIVPISKYKNNAKIKCPHSGCNTIFSHKINCVFDSHHYSDISPDAFTHSLDRKAISAVRKVPGVDYALKKMMEYGYEKILRVNSMADDVKVTPKTCSYIHDMVEQSSKCLGISQPDLFINQNPNPNAFTFGIEYPIISIQSGLIELLTEDELYAVVAHETTHIKCHHVLYHMLTDFLVDAANVLGVVGGFLIPLKLTLLEWSRKAELSADRGALLVTNNKDASIKLLMKLAGGSAQLSELIDEADFLSQAEQFEKMTEGIGLNKVYRIASNITRTHPFPVVRAYEINKWADSEEYKSIYNGDYKKRSEAIASETYNITECPHCGKKLKANDMYCDNCGQNTNNLKNQYGQSGYECFVDGIRGGATTVLNYLSSGKDPKNSAFNKKVCPQCNTEFFEPDTQFCPIDGNELIEDRRDNQANTNYCIHCGAKLPTNSDCCSKCNAKIE